MYTSIHNRPATLRRLSPRLLARHSAIPTHIRNSRAGTGNLDKNTPVCGFQHSNLVPKQTADGIADGQVQDSVSFDDEACNKLILSRYYPAPERMLTCRLENGKAPVSCCIGKRSLTVITSEPPMA